ncbi:MAG: 1-deoxy-D-xylulose-5-phosphate synthase [Actinomycetia bacterium]|nr:1-deoxy-D-xylulose-5-phosphate synthase [Actinomycetes bacterium]MCH9800204.1 1-deoxy-D-xylulose-5-phosphate synthase [Actinomycetes bacterium]
MLQRINSPADLKRLDVDQLPQLAQEVREFLIQKVSRTGGHLGPNLGVVELTLALHRVFDSPNDQLIWDTGHQSYVHKIITGRRELFDSLRQPGGLSGYPAQSESEHDFIENSHASTALSYADGLAKAHQLTGESADRKVVAIVGDGSLTGGMAWEALNNIAAADRPTVIVVNDNARSYAPTIGGLANHLAALRTAGGYERMLRWGRSALGRTPLVGKPMFDTLHGVKKGVKDMLAPQGMFEDLGLKYIGPIDGHDVEQLERSLRQAAGFPGPVIVHCLTEKGHGYAPAESDERDRFHGVGVIDPTTGEPARPSGPSWTGVFADALVAEAASRPEVVAITAAMPGPTGLSNFAAAYPDRFFDVGIAEQHAVTSAAGLAMGGCHPVVAVYATFLNRAYDQVLLDVALHKLPVTFVLDRAGITGEDGPSHNGMWDLSMLAGVPGMQVAAPRDAETLDAAVREALAVADGPTAVRFPKGTLPEPLPALRRMGSVDVLADHGDDVLLVAVGAMAADAVAAAALLADQGIGVTVVDPRWVLPVPEALRDLAAAARLVVTVEDNLVHGGVGAAVRAAIPAVPMVVLGIPADFPEQGRRPALLADFGLDAGGIAESVAKEWFRGQFTRT